MINVGKVGDRGQAPSLVFDFKRANTQVRPFYEGRLVKPVLYQNSAENNLTQFAQLGNVENRNSWPRQLRIQILVSNIANNQAGCSTLSVVKLHEKVVYILVHDAHHFYTFWPCSNVRSAYPESVLRWAKNLG